MSHRFAIVIVTASAATLLTAGLLQAQSTLLPWNNPGNAQALNEAPDPPAGPAPRGT